MTQVDSQQRVGLSLFYQFLIRFGSLSFFMWWLLLALLAPLWGWYIWDMSETMVARADFMQSRGLIVSPSIEIFKTLGWREILGAGSLLGFLFYALPIAMVVSLFEALARSFSSRKVKWILRGMSLLWIFSPLGMAIRAFCSSILLCFLLGVLCMLVCFCLARLLELIHQKTNGSSFKRRVFVVILMMISVSHFLTHPVLHIAFQPQAYKNVNAMTLVRDWLLLNENSSHWVNSWYYNHTAIAMEREKITVFQPMIVGLVDIDEKVWLSRFRSFFAYHPKDHGTKIKFLHLKPNEPIKDYIEKDFVHFVAIGAHRYQQLQKEVESWPEISYAFFGTKPHPNIPQEVFYTPQNYYGKPYTRWGFRLKETPVLKRKDLLQDVGLNEFQSKANNHFKGGLAFLLTHPNYSIPLLILILTGALVILFRLMLLTSLINPWLVLLLSLLMSVYWIPGLKNNVLFWTSEGGLESKSPELRILALNELSMNPLPKKLSQLLNEEMSDDLRIAKWQVSCMAAIYKNNTDHEKQKALRWIQKVLDQYHDYPFGFRYKLIEAAVKMAPLYDRINKLSRSEKHIYVRWYAENYGLGI